LESDAVQENTMWDSSNRISTVPGRVAMVGVNCDPLDLATVESFLWDYVFVWPLTNGVWWAEIPCLWK
jgi:hypothetical protein